VISRVADHCFWFGRYLDRAESTARLLQATRSLVFDADIPVTQCWQPLVIVSGDLEVFVKRLGSDQTGNGEVVQHYMTWDLDSQVSLRRIVQAARESARNIRDVLSIDAWEETNELHLWLGSAEAETLYRENREQFFRKVRRSTQLVLGLIRSTMLHDTPMSFLWLGAMLERAGQTARILDMHHHTMIEEGVREGVRAAADGAPGGIVEVALWLSLLKACSGQEAFLKRHQGRVSARAVVSFLLFERQFPRSLRYTLASSRKLLGDIWPPQAETGPARDSYARLTALEAWLDRRAMAFAPEEIHQLLTHVVDETALTCAAIGKEIQGPPRPTPAQSQSQSAPAQ
jgi:uncharacterized alpha-E superfamily protein